MKSPHESLSVESELKLEEQNELIAQRRAKLSALREQGQAYPNHFRRNALATALHEAYDAFDHDALGAKNIQVAVAGRMMMRRLMGKASFISLQDMSGRIQIYLTQNDLGEAYEDVKHWDLGDIVGIEGELFKTKTNELTIKARRVSLLTKSLRPLPDKFHGLVDHEQRYRQRYLDLMTNEETRRVFVIRSAIVNELRKFLIAKGFLEVETPMMHVIPGGATARPFMTHHNALDMTLYLRVAPELYLKRLVVGGFEKVFEINRSFRNEGLSTRHNPEFTMVEFYQAYADYKEMMVLTEELLRHLAQTVLETPVIHCAGEQYDFSKPFRYMTLKESILHHNPSLTEADLNSLEKLRGIAKNLQIALTGHEGIGKIQYEIFEKTVEAHLKEPTFITDYPTEVSPLARANDENPFVTDRFEFFVGGRELANGFSELNDPDDQAARFHAQVDQKDKGNDEAMHFDADYITALEYGMPPTAGEGIGIDRLTMLFADQPSIRDVILFPHMRPD
ncbi:MAG: lysine--tRNA ligase [Gammaproteobacteria bacterium]|nr:lysine--tRNA ligase [Gammaproteobacteria bacterium]